MLTKSDFKTYLDCSRHFWVKMHDKASYQDEMTLMSIYTMKQGYMVENIAHGLFPEGISIPHNDARGFAETLGNIAAGAPVIYQATVIADDLLARADILVKNPEGSYDLYEVKATARAKLDHTYDAGFQSVVFERAGITIRNISIIHLNKTYIRAGEHEAARLLTITDITEAVAEKRSDIELKISDALKVMTLSPSEMPDALEPCHKPKDCPCLSSCHPELPEYSIYDITNLSPKSLAALRALGITSLADIPDDVKLSSKQREQVLLHKSGQPRVNQEGISKLLGTLEYPLYFLDYETVSLALPALDGHHPYQQVPFQYSLHVVHEDGTQEHHEYLARSTADMGVNLAKSMCSHIGPTGTIIAWHKAFESGRNTEMGQHMPEHCEFFENLNSRMFDLEDIFKEGHFCHPGFKGKTSIKNVLPVMVPELSYKALGIQEGGTASWAWYKAVFEEMGKDEKEKVFNDLLAYCKLDTLAMVRIWESLGRL